MICKACETQTSEAFRSLWFVKQVSAADHPFGSLQHDLLSGKASVSKRTAESARPACREARRGSTQCKHQQCTGQVAGLLQNEKPENGRLEETQVFHDSHPQRYMEIQWILLSQCHGSDLEGRHKSDTQEKKLPAGITLSELGSRPAGPDQGPVRQKVALACEHVCKYIYNIAVMGV